MFYKGLVFLYSKKQCYFRVIEIKPRLLTGDNGINCSFSHLLSSMEAALKLSSNMSALAHAGLSPLIFVTVGLHGGEGSVEVVPGGTSSMKMYD